MKSRRHDALKNWNGPPTLLLQGTIQDLVSELDNDVQKKVQNIKEVNDQEKQAQLTKMVVHK